MRGNVVDLAVGVVIGAAFNSVVNSLVNDIITPPIGLLTGKVNFSDLAIKLADNATIKYGLFIQALIAFIITAFALFLVIRIMNRLAKKEKENPTPEGKSAELTVLEEIRDSLKK